MTATTLQRFTTVPPGIFASHCPSEFDPGFLHGSSRPLALVRRPDMRRHSGMGCRRVLAYVPLPQRASPQRSMEHIVP